MAEAQVAPLVWMSDDGEQWLVEIEVEPEGESGSFGPASRCASLKISPGPDPHASATGSITPALIRELPIGALVEQARLWPEKRKVLDAAFFGGAVLDVLIAANIISVLRDDDEVVVAAVLAEGPVKPEALGTARLDKPPRAAPRGVAGSPPISADFLAELLQVHQLATYFRLPKMRTVSRYLEARVREPLDQKTIGRYLTRARQASGGTASS